jgi:hypothetical protein
MKTLTKNLLFIFICFIGIFFIGCSSNHDMTEGLSDEGKMLYGFIAQAGEQIEKKYGMLQSSIGGGVDHGIWLMSLDFHRYGSALTEAEARRLITNCLDDFLELANQDEKLRPFLKVHPLKPENIELGIINYNAVNRRESFHPYITVVTASRGEIGYFTKEESDKFRYKSEKYESYKEAVTILLKEKEQTKP